MKKIILFFCLFILNTSAFAFYDVKSNYWASGAIEKWSNMGYISGYPDGSFRGNNNITRAEVIAIVNKLDNSSLKTNKREGNDLVSSNWFFNDMNKATKLGLIFADENGKLRPNDKATREEVGVILARLFNISYTGSLKDAKISNYSDKNDISPENYRYIAGMVEEGFINGYKDNTLRLKSNITRAEFISIINNTISYIYSAGSYDGKVLVGNVLINGENVKLINSEILGKIFIVDGARENPPELINTKVSNGVNSRVGKILIKDNSEYITMSEYNFENPEEYYDPIFATIKYNDEDWTNDDVKVRVSFDEKGIEVENSKNNNLYIDKNGKHEIKYEQNGRIRTTTIDLDNIDSRRPIISLGYEIKDEKAIIRVDIKDDGLSEISKIRLSNGMTNRRDEETGEIDKEFIVDENGKYTVSVEDLAGNVSKKDIEIEDIP